METSSPSILASATYLDMTHDEWYVERIDGRSGCRFLIFELQPPSHSTKMKNKQQSSNISIS